MFREIFPVYGYNSALTVRQGEWVEAGAIIALSGNTGRPAAPHVHYEVMPAGRSSVQQRKTDKLMNRDSPPVAT